MGQTIKPLTLIIALLSAPSFANEGLAGNTRILTPRGYVDANTLTAGGTVWRCKERNCHEHQITAVQKFALNNLVQISFKERTVIVGEGQLFLVGTEWISANKITSGMKVATRTGQEEVSSIALLSDDDIDQDIIAISLASGHEPGQGPYHEYHITDLDLVTHNSPASLAVLTPIGIFLSGIGIFTLSEQAVWGTLSALGVAMVINNLFNH